MVDAETVAGFEADAEERVAEIRVGIGSVAEPPASEMFDFAFSEPPETLQAQRREALGGD